MMIFVNWATVIAGVMSIAGVAIMASERNRLREHLAMPQDAASRGKRALSSARDDDSGQQP